MDAETVIHAPVVQRRDENGFHGDNSYEGDEAIEAEMVNGNLDILQISDANASSEILSGSENCDIANTLVEVVNSEECMQSNGSAAPVEVEVQEIHQEKNSKKQTGQAKNKTEKKLASKTAAGPVGLKKTNSGKELKVTSNGTRTATSRPKQPILTSTKSFNGGPIATGYANKVKPALSTSNAKHTKQPAKPQPTSSNNNVANSDGAMEKTKLRPLRKEAQPKIKADEESIKSPTDGDAKAHRVGKLPAYDFSFRCNERAEKRREFYSKLEEKIHAKEEEINNEEAKSKESQQAEIKMLRKSLNFKATPMPTFYQEPPPPKVELKKIPTTRPKSPKLGRRKSSSPADTESVVSHNQPKVRLSLGVKVSLDKAKAAVPVHSQKPHRRSLPKLPSQKVTLSKEAPKAPPSRQDLNDETAVPPTQMEQETGAAELIHAENVGGNEAAVELGNGQTAPARVRAPVTEEQ